MKEPSTPPSPKANPQNREYSTRPAQAGSARISRRQLLSLGLAAGGTALIGGAFPRLAASSAASADPVEPGAEQHNLRRSDSKR